MAVFCSVPAELLASSPDWPFDLQVQICIRVSGGRPFEVTVKGDTVKSLLKVTTLKLQLDILPVPLTMSPAIAIFTGLPPDTLMHTIKRALASTCHSQRSADAKTKCDMCDNFEKFQLQVDEQ